MEDPHEMKKARLKEASVALANDLGNPLTGTSKWDKDKWLATCLHLCFLWKQQRDQLAAEAAALQSVCDTCSGDGLYDGGHWQGKCFRCDGKGWQDDTDKLRNAKYDRYHAATPTPSEANASEAATKTSKEVMVAIDVTDIAVDDAPF